MSTTFDFTATKTSDSLDKSTASESANKAAEHWRDEFLNSKVVKAAEADPERAIVTAAIVAMSALAARGMASDAFAAFGARGEAKVACAEANAVWPRTGSALTVEAAQAARASAPTHLDLNSIYAPEVSLGNTPVTEALARLRK